MEFILRFLRFCNRIKNRILRKFFTHRRGHHREQTFFINHTQKTIYVANPKVASRSIIDMCNGVTYLDFIHGPYNKKKQMLTCIFPSFFHIDYGRVFGITRDGTLHERRTWLKEKERQSYFFFSFVRNPFDRIVSAYYDKVVRESLVLDKEKQKVLFGKVLTDTPEDFLIFLEKYIEAHDTKLLDFHFKPQHVVLDIDRELDYTGHLESFSDDWKKLQQDIPQLKSHVHINKSHRKNPSSYYFTTRKAINIVYKKYQKDVEQFGYTDSYTKLLNDLKT